MEIEMKPTEVLVKEHDAILVMLEILKAVSTRLENKKPVKPEHLPQIVEFIQVFADKCHHGKEENLLFKSMVKAGMPEEGGPISVMLSEHEMGRDFVRKMDAAASAFINGDRSAVTQFIQNARGYASLLSQHIQKENKVLFPMADKVIPQEEQSQLLEEFEKVETEVVGAGVHEKFHELLDQLRSEYLE
jgi:hemerythrin-like domain-containing protein